MRLAPQRLLSAMALTVLLAASALPSVAQTVLPELDQCDRLVRDAPDDPGSYYCYTQAAMRSGDIASSILRLEQIYHLDRSRLRALLQLGVLEAVRNGERAGPLLEEAVSRLGEAGDVWGEVYARSSLAQVLTGAGRRNEAQAVLDASAALAREAGQPVMRAHVLVDHARLALVQEDYGRALELYRRAGTIVLPSGPTYLRSWVLSGLGAAYWALGQRWEAIDSYVQEVQLLESQGNRWQVAGPLFNIALMTAELYDAGEAEEDQIVERLDTALAAARLGRNVSLEASCRRLRAQVLGEAGGLAELDRAERLSAAIGDASGVWETRLLRAGLLALGPPPDRAAAQALAEELLRQAREAGDLRRQGLALALLSGAARERGDREAALASGQAAAAVIEKLSHRQSGGGEVRLRAFGALASFFDHLAGWLVASLPVSPEPEADLDLAVSLSERTRGRSLVEHAAGPPEQTPRVAQLQRSLRRGEALVVFQSWPSSPRARPEEYGRPWALYIDRTHSFTYPLPAEQVLEDQVHAFIGLLGGEEAGATAAARTLFDELLRPAFDDAGEPIERLVLVPDGPLHILPFAAVLDGGRDVDEELALSSAPSVRAWFGWRTRAAADPGTRGVLSLARPALERARDGGFLREAGWWIDSAELDPLAFAREEGSRLVSRFGGRLLTGVEASELAVKNAPLSRYAVLHFATHALVSHLDPRRSAVLLARGAGGEDGLLRSEEIADLALDGQVVLLSACEGAGGEIVEGEGVMGLARAFFVAGARSVVAPLRPVSDRSASVLIAALGAQLERGESLDRSLSRARNRLREAGYPPQAWSAWIVLGDGSMGAGGGARGRTYPGLAGAVLVLLLVALLALLVRRRAGWAG